MTSRCKNFTEREKCTLLNLVQTYKHIIENKCTNAVTTIKKNEAWEAITTAFNSSAEVPRSQKQLNNAYLNLKRSTRKDIADENVKKYLQLKDTISTPDKCGNEEGPSQMSTSFEEPNIKSSTEIKCVLRQYKKDEIADKKGIKATGGGTYTPVLSTLGAQMLAVMGDQVKPLSNSCDSASSYYINNEDNAITGIPTKLETAEPLLKNIPNPQNKTEKKVNDLQQKKRKVHRNNDYFKRKYYSTKLECAMLEKKTKLLEYKVALSKLKLQELEFKIKQKEFESKCILEK